MNLPPGRLARFLISTAVPGAYARGVRDAHERAQRVQDANTMQVLAAMTLWAAKSETPASGEQARSLRSVLNAFSQQSDVELATVLDPHSASVTKALLSRSAS
ncbi:hypothetical protein [Jatrophihabitans sp. GAS493]|uniref:hypothetical protein n=1 Tax=Jatrophihabitans sp. GAS493 TaxID=1907575 RepID=UPI000BB69BD6|nr:hypothetical protein [Jatrophihabitans sp. GAS493]